MKKLFLQSVILIVASLLIISSLVAQSPHGIPYQAVMRNADGSVMANSTVNMTFMIHDGTASGTVVYQESHALTSNAQGLVSCVVGNGVVSQGNFSSINWGSGAKFLHVMMGTADLGTQQMMSVPYALYSGSTHVSVSPTGDTLTVGGQSVIVPGISAANPTNNTPTSGLGAQVLPGNTTCANEFISVTGCNGQTSLTYDGRTYDLVEIGGQCWFADNLATDQYRNGDAIPTGLDNNTWQNTTAGAYAIYNNEPANDATYGKLYNWYTTVDSRGLCPTGWHVPTDCEWMYLEGALGMSAADQELYGANSRGSIEGGAMKATANWNYPNTAASNISGFNGLPGAYRLFNGGYNFIGYGGYWWTSSQRGSINAWGRSLSYNDARIGRGDFSYNQNGFSLRCVKTADINFNLGCTDGFACNFQANANQDDGSCFYQNATCDDGNSSTINDVINANCQCIGSSLNSGNVSIGQDYQGGKVAYIFQPSDVGYVAGETHGLIATAQDLPVTYQWGCYLVTINGASGQTIGTGYQNTLDIVNTGCVGAARTCFDLVLNGYSDWFLPSLLELTQLYNNRNQIGGFQSDWYWSSSRSNSVSAWLLYFASGFPSDFCARTCPFYVRPVRVF